MAKWMCTPLQTEQLTVSVKRDENLGTLSKIDSPINQRTKSELSKSGALSFRI
jgi:hypothetical protein